MRENGMNPTVIRAGKTSLFSSKIFIECFVNACGVPIELYDNDGSVGAATGAGIGIKELTLENAFNGVKAVEVVEPNRETEYNEIYSDWKEQLDRQLLSS